jgi:hypothetical protein
MFSTMVSTWRARTKTSTIAPSTSVPTSGARCFARSASRTAAAGTTSAYGRNAARQARARSARRDGSLRTTPKLDAAAAPRKQPTTQPTSVTAPS